MDKVLTIIVAAAVIMLIAVVIIPVLVSTLGNTGETSEGLQNDSCQFQVDRAKRADRPGMVEDRCLDYIEDPEFKTEAESTETSCILTGLC